MLLTQINKTVPIYAVAFVCTAITGYFCDKIQRHRGLVIACKCLCAQARSTLRYAHSCVPYSLAGLVHDLFDHRLLRIQPQGPLCSSRLYDRRLVVQQRLVSLIRVVHIWVHAARSARCELSLRQRDGQPGANLRRLSLSFRTKP